MHKGSLIHILNGHRALVMAAVLFCLLSLFAPNFLSIHNVTTILKGASLNAVVAIGFTLILILGQLDLSIGAVVMLCGMLVVGLQPQLGWVGSILVSLAVGGMVGLVNGLLVVKARVNSFIVTLGTMTIVMGLTHLYSEGGTRAIDDFRLADWLDRPVLPLLPPMTLITLLLVTVFTVFLAKTRPGRNFFLVGGNPEAAWLAGLNRDRYLMAGFILCGFTAAAGGALFAASQSSMTSSAVLGTRTLMTVLAAVIIGGTLMTGGKGSVLNSYFAVLLLNTLFNGIGCFGLGFEVQIFANGLILAVVVLYEAWALHRQELLQGQRPDLIAEFRDGAVFPGEPGAKAFRGRGRLAAAVALVAGIAAVVMLVVAFLQGTAVTVPEDAQIRNWDDVYSLKGTDNQPYLLPPGLAKTDIPERPADPKALPETDKLHWWDIEYAGWKVEKAAMPVSPGDGPQGKRVVLLKAGDHPYWTAYVRGFTAIADFYGMRIKVYNGNWNMDLQAQQADQAINERPDMIILAPVDATGCTPLLRKIHRAGIPCITSNTTPCDEAMKYCIAWTGPDDWGQFRMLARAFADALGKQGGYAVIRHMPGSSPFFSRTFAPITELREYAPDMSLLAMDTTNLEAEATMQMVGAWLSKFGPELKGLILAGDDFPMTGTLEALKKAGRDDVVIVAAGNSKTGMDAVKAGETLAITYQSAEGDGALAVHAAARWFRGETLDPVVYLPRHVITREDVEQFMPAQW
jgi:ribose/xylose/arabinose/galactoside ABC-type transport system permease subunit/ABC-type sugar transport system substrate-binding protein